MAETTVKWIRKRTQISLVAALLGASATVLLSSATSAGPFHGRATVSVPQASLPNLLPAQSSRKDLFRRPPTRSLENSLDAARKALRQSGFSHPGYIDMEAHEKVDKGHGAAMHNADRLAEQRKFRDAIIIYDRVLNQIRAANLRARNEVIGDKLRAMRGARYPSEQIARLRRENARLARQICTLEVQGFTGIPKKRLELAQARRCITAADAFLADKGSGTRTGSGRDATGDGLDQTKRKADRVIGTAKQKADAAIEQGQKAITGLAGDAGGVIDQVKDAWKKGQFAPISPSDAAAIAVAVASILIAAGIATNLAQAIATAIANATQAGVEVTANDIGAGIVLGKLGIDPELGETKAQAEGRPEPKPPPPNLEDPETGEPYPMNDKGQYRIGGEWVDPDEAERRWRLARVEKMMAEEEAAKKTQGGKDEGTAPADPKAARRAEFDELAGRVERFIANTDLDDTRTGRYWDRFLRLQSAVEQRDSVSPADITSMKKILGSLANAYAKEAKADQDAAWWQQRKQDAAEVGFWGSTGAIMILSGGSFASHTLGWTGGWATGFGNAAGGANNAFLQEALKEESKLDGKTSKRVVGNTIVGAITGVLADKLSGGAAGGYLRQFAGNAGVAVAESAARDKLDGKSVDWERATRNGLISGGASVGAKALGDGLETAFGPGRDVDVETPTSASSADAPATGGTRSATPEAPAATGSSAPSAAADAPTPSQTLQTPEAPTVAQNSGASTSSQPMSSREVREAFDQRMQEFERMSSRQVREAVDRRLRELQRLEGPEPSS